MPKIFTGQENTFPPHLKRLQQSFAVSGLQQLKPGSWPGMIEIIFFRDLSCQFDWQFQDSAHGFECLFPTLEQIYLYAACQIQRDEAICFYLCFWDFFNLSRYSCKSVCHSRLLPLCSNFASCVYQLPAVLKSLSC